MRRSLLAGRPSSVMMRSTSAVPSVSVPVLSKSRARAAQRLDDGAALHDHAVAGGA